MMKQQPPSTSVYPTLEATAQSSAAPAMWDPQQFRLQKIGEFEVFLRSEVECRGRLHKKYRRAVNVLDGTCAALGTTCIVNSVVGFGLLASGIGFVAGITLEVVSGVAGLFDVAGVAVSRRCSAKAAKHEAVRMLAASKLNTVHSHISKALEDCLVSDDEYKLILDEVEKYRTTKEELRHKHAHAAGSVIDEETRSELIRLGRNQAHASFIKNSLSIQNRRKLYFRDHSG